MRRVSAIARGRALTPLVLVVACLRCTPSADDAPAGDLRELRAIPEVAAMMQAASPARANSDGTTRLGSSLTMDLPEKAADPMQLRIAGEAQPITIRRLDPDRGTRERHGDGNVVRYGKAARGADAVLFARGSDIEELLVLHEPVVTGYRLALPPAWKLRPAADPNLYEITDASTNVRVTLRADRAWDATGAAVTVRTSLDDDAITFTTEGARVYPVVIDPTWSSALSPIRIRAGLTTTLLGDGTLLLAGGGATPKSTELMDPYRSTIALGPDMTAPRTHHTATMLPSGKVLLAGGGTATAELYDPSTHTFAATGSMAVSRMFGAAVRLRSGKVLVAGGSTPEDAEIYDPATGKFTATSARVTTGRGSMATLPSGSVMLATDSASEIFDPTAAAGAGAWAAAALPAPPSVPGVSGLTVLRDGRVVVTAGTGCGAVNTLICMGRVWILNPANGTSTPVASWNFGRIEPTTALLPDGTIVFAGGTPDDTVKTAEIFNADAPSLVTDGPTSNGHGDATSVMVPGADVLVIGGTQAAIDRRTYPGTFHASAAMVTPRIKHGAVRLHDGKILVTGGGTTQNLAPVTTSAEIFDPAAETFAAAGNLVVARYGHTSTTLASGKVLVTGGGVPGSPSPVTIFATAEIYDPSLPIASRAHAVGSMSKARMDHVATLLPNGQVLVTGGCVARKFFGSVCDAASTIALAELFDPVTEKFTTLPPMLAARLKHGAVVLPNGKVLVTGGSDASADLYDPLTKTFKATSPSGAARDGRTAHLLPDGRVFVAGGTTLAPDVYDPTTETWSFAAPLPLQFPDTLWAMEASGRLVSAGGLFGLDGINPDEYVFDPLAARSGSFQFAGTDNSVARTGASITLAGSGQAVVIGGDFCNGACVADPAPLAGIHGDNAPASARPTLVTVPATVTAGTKVTLAGTRFANGTEGTSGTQSASPTNYPLAVWVSDLGDAVIPGTILDFTDTSATWLVPATALYGHGLLFISANGVLSAGASVTIAPAGKAVQCTYDAECGTGFCVDGVCCDTRCDGKCDGCSAKRKTTGADGVCGPVPPGRDIAGRCFSTLGASCKAGLECVTGFCAQGVCCDSTCTGSCQACNQKAHNGICSPINNGACGAACDGDHTVKQTGSPDVDCAPYKCEGATCKPACGSVKDCVAPFVCTLDGQCASPSEPSPGEGGVCSCEVVGGTRSGARGLTMFLLAALAAFTARARRQRGRA